MWPSVQVNIDSSMEALPDSDEENSPQVGSFAKSDMIYRYSTQKSLIEKKLDQLKRTVEGEQKANIGNLGLLDPFMEPKFDLWQFLLEDISKIKAKIKIASPFHNFLMKTNATVVSPISNGFFCILPREIMMHIFSFLNLTDLSRCMRICKEWKEIALEDSFYKTICEQQGFVKAISKPESKTWRWLCCCNMIKFTTKKEGCGSYMYPEDKGFYIGDWKNDLKQGHGKFTWHDGAVYEGEWQEDRREGFGFMRWQDGQTYTGMWKNSRKEGYGEEVWPDGRKYIGEYKHSNMHGFGTYVWPGGDIYVGEWREDNIHGEGTYTWQNGSKYEGQWACDEHNGYGVYTCPGGESYEGYWLKNLRNGFGDERWGSGHKYSGEWKENKKHGKGKFTWPDGDFYSGEWREGKRFSKGLLVTGDKVYFQEWKQGEVVIDEIDKGVNNSVLLGSRQEFEGDSEGHSWCVEKVLKRKRDFSNSEEYRSYQAKKARTE